MFHRQRVLIIDSSPYFNRSTWSLLLPEAEFNLIGPACEEEQAVKMAATRSPHLVLVDLCRTEQTGLKCISQLHAAHPHLPIIALTPDCFHQEYESRALEAGASVSLEKSNLAESLQDTLVRLLPLNEATTGWQGWLARQPQVKLIAIWGQSFTAALKQVPEYLIYMGLGLVGGAMGAALAIWLTMVVQLLLPSPADFLPGPLMLLVMAALMSIGASWLLSQLVCWLSPRLLPQLKGQSLPVVMVSSVSASLLQTILFTRSW